MVTSTHNALPQKSPSYSLHFDSFGRLIFVDAAGQTHENVRIVRAFPITDPECWISIVGAGGHELALITDLRETPRELRDVVTAELSRREFLPQIRRIVHISGRIEPCEWQVETDRGPHRFVLKAYEDVQRLGSNRAIIQGGEGVRYLIPDLQSLDRVSRAYLERYL